MQIYVDHSADFWPSGWMVWLCAGLGVLDVSLVVFLIVQVVRH